MRKTLLLLLAVLSAALCSGCAAAYKPHLPEPHASFAMRNWQSRTAKEDNCLSFIYDGRRYLYYSELSRALTENDVGRCLGCVSQDGAEREDELILTLSGDSEHNYLVVWYDAPGSMPPPHAVYRAEDTRLREIRTPECVASPAEDDPMYRHWTER